MLARPNRGRIKARDSRPDRHESLFPPSSCQAGELELDALNREILVRIQESGLAVPSNARINGRFAIRIANTNHRTQRKDFDLLLKAVLDIGEDLTRTLGSQQL